MESILLVLELVAMGYLLYVVFANDRKRVASNSDDGLGIFTYKIDPTSKPMGKKD